MQRKYKLRFNRYLIEFQDKYYVVNNYTYKFINTLKNCEDEQNFAKKMNISLKKALIFLEKFQTEIENCDYYNFNLFLPSPIKIQWKITNNCNLKCKHCYLGILDKECLSKDNLLKIANKIVQSQAIEVTLTGGEVLTVPSIFEIIEVLIKNGININIFTNAILLDTFLDKCKIFDRNMLKFLISLDGDKQEHELIRGENTFNVTLRNIKKSVSLGFDTTVNCVINKLNVQGIPSMLEKLVKINVQKIQFSHLITIGNANEDLQLTSQAIKQLQKNILEKMKQLENPPIFIFLKDSESDDNTKTIYKQNNTNSNTFINLGQEKWLCCAGISRVTINHKGDALCCPFISDLKLGNILNNSLQEIWKSKNRFLFLKKIQENKNNRKCLIKGMDNNGSKN